MTMKKIFTTASLLCVVQSCILTLSGSTNINHVGPANIHHAKVNHISIVGPATLNDITAESLKITGSLSFKKINVAGDAVITGSLEKGSDGQFGHLHVTGTFTAQDLHCNELSVTGPATLTHAHVIQNATFFGPLKATECSFNTISITGDTIELTNTDATNIIVKKKNSDTGFLSWVGGLFKPKSSKKHHVHQEDPHEEHQEEDIEEILRLSGNSTINGNISFESKKGHVIIMPTVLVKGTITGATIERCK